MIIIKNKARKITPNINLVKFRVFIDINVFFITDYPPNFVSCHSQVYHVIFKFIFTEIFWLHMICLIIKNAKNYQVHSSSLI